MPGPVSAMAMPVGRAPSRQSERSVTPDRVPTPFRDQRSSKTLHKLVLSRLVEEFLWVGGNIVSGSKWKLGLMGKHRDEIALNSRPFYWANRNRYFAILIALDKRWRCFCKSKIVDFFSYTFGFQVLLNE